MNLESAGRGVLLTVLCSFFSNIFSNSTRVLTVCLLILFLQGTSQVLATTYKDLKQKLPEIIAQKTSDKHQQSQAMNCLIEFVPYILSGTCASQDGTDDFLQAIVQDAVGMIDISCHAIHINLIDKYKLTCPSTSSGEGVATYAKSPWAQLEPESLDLLRSLSAFGLASTSGNPRIALHGGMGLYGQIKRVYSQDPGYTTSDWDFVLQEDGLEDILGLLQTSRQDKESILQQVKDSGQATGDGGADMSMSPIGFNDPPWFFDVYFGSILVRLLLRRPVNNDRISLIEIQQFKRQSLSAPYKRLVTIDLYLSSELPETETIHFEGLGWLPVFSLRSLLDEMKYAVDNLHYRQQDFVQRALIWQNIEQSNRKLDDDFFAELMALGHGEETNTLATYNQGELSVASDHPYGFGKFKRATTIHWPCRKLPPPTIPFLYSKEELGKKLHVKLKALSQPIEKQKEAFRESRNSFNDLLNAWEHGITSSLITHDADFRRVFTSLCENMEKLSSYGDHVISRPFLQFADKFCSMSCKECFAKRLRFYTIIYDEIIHFEKEFTKLNMALMRDRGFIKNIDLVLKSKMIAAALSVSAYGIHKKLCSMTLGGMTHSMNKMKGVHPVLHATQLYSFMLHDLLQSDYANPSPLIGAGLHWGWLDVFRYIISKSMPLLEDFSIDKIDYLTQQLAATGLVVEDLTAVNLTLRFVLEKCKHQEWMKSAMPSMDLFNTELDKVLSSEIWLPKHHDNTDFSGNDIKMLLHELDVSGICSNSIHKEISRIKDKWERFDMQREQKMHEAMHETIAELEDFEKRHLETEQQLHKLSHSMQLSMQIFPVEVAPLSYQTKKETDLPNRRQARIRKREAEQNEKIAFNWKSARAKLNSGDYSGAISDYNCCLLIAEKYRYPHVWHIMLELTDASAQYVMSERKKLGKFVQTLTLYHSEYREAASFPQNHAKLPSRCDLEKLTSDLVDVLRVISPLIEKSMINHENTILELKVIANSGLNDVAIHFEFLKKSIGWMVQLNQQIVDHWSLLKETFTFRKRWLEGLQTGRKTTYNKPLHLKEYLQEIDRQQQHSQSLLFQSQDLQESLLKIGDGCTIPVVMPKTKIVSKKQSPSCHPVVVEEENAPDQLPAIEKLRVSAPLSPKAM